MNTKNRKTIRIPQTAALATEAASEKAFAARAFLIISLFFVATWIMTGIAV